MKVKQLILFVVCTVVVVFSEGCAENERMPFIVVESSVTDVVKTGDIVVFRIKFRSNDGLKYFEIRPSVQGVNLDCVLEYSFRQESYFARVNYLYVVPDSMANGDCIVFTMKVSDSKNEKVKREKIVIRNSELLVENVMEEDRSM